VPTFSYGQPAPVVVELFSSQGCASCPPADKFLLELAQQRNIIALGWHVDYWDYIGWKDAFAHPAFTERQKAYARALNQRMIYTPQFIINGAESPKVGRRAEIAALIQKYAQLAPGADLSIRRVGASYDVILQNAQSSGRYDVQLVSVSPLETVEISRGGVWILPIVSPDGKTWAAGTALAQPLLKLEYWGQGGMLFWYNIKTMVKLSPPNG
jgi:hypothetical protein